MSADFTFTHKDLPKELNDMIFRGVNISYQGTAASRFKCRVCRHYFKTDGCRDGSIENCKFVLKKNGVEIK